MTKARIYLKEWRNHKGITLEDLASRIGIEAPSVARLEHTPLVFSSQTLSDVAEALGVEPHELLKPPS